ncbi:HAMP domain-containing sensor histidine kinase [Floccifex sp.]|uniref:HAMP domain-containing sensor histidine kinase n=1 Tax=Floccifex sp. TaxID=2815810 RepID=UPI002A7580C6|nr:HAMP domain-containing sensor histidine kinase [Floccifex sp.]MDD7280426.1 HAMP domain-containing sensor histidine kinase [Erysipelotrichaceae bacterium]MDY2957572.1 HAMP domain-containing sensor histidine kinase [Floccifex sp.]
MKKFKQLFHKLSLTKQFVSIIFLCLIAFLIFFFAILRTGINNTIETQMVSMLQDNQRPIVNLIENEGNVDEEFYSYLAKNSTQVDCLIRNNVLHVFGGKDDKIGNVDLYEYLIKEASDMSPVNNVEYGTVMIDDMEYYYSLVFCTKSHVIVASFMDNTYPSSFRSILVDSTVYLIIIAFILVFMVILIWVFSIIQPLSQIKDYITQINMGKDVELNINRGDEIGQVAHSIVVMKDELTKQEKSKEEMIHNISHDLKTPIATIKSYGESIKDGIYPYGDLESSVDVIIDNANRLEKKVYNLLYLNRIEYLLTSDSEGVVTNMKEVVEEVVLNSAVIRPEIEVITDIEEVFFDGLLEAWRVCIENIMDNAFRYAKTYIKIEVREDDLRISNDGPKMSEDRIETLFHPFEKGEKGKFGLGLSIVSKVTKTNNYLVKGYNTDDGVCFRIYREPVEEKKKTNSSWKKRETKGE